MSKIDFTTRSYYGHRISIADLDRDGKADLVISNYYSKSISVFSNTTVSSSISFADQVEYKTGVCPRPVAIADIDGDGFPDLAVGNEIDNTISTFRNISKAGAISFADKVDHNTGNWPYGIFIGDLNGDGKPEIVTSNVKAQTVSILRNEVDRPNITSFTPTEAIEGSIVTIRGTNFSNATGVSFGDVAATSFTIVSDTTINAHVGAGASGRVTVTTAKGTGTRDGFSFLLLPTITSFSPASAGPGTTVTITGTQFDRTSSVTFGGTPAVSFTIVSTDTITAIVGNGVSGSVAVTTPAGTTSKEGFSFTGNPPVITSFSPTKGTKGDIVTISGTNFSANADSNIVYFGPVKAKVLSSTQTSITTQVPEGATDKPITVTANKLTAYSSKPFRVIFSSSNIFTANSLSRNDHPTIAGPPTNISSSDIDGDGKPDLVEVNEFTNSVSIFLNLSVNGELSFAPRVDFVTDGTPYGVAVADFDGDGKPDLAVISRGTLTVSVFINTSTKGTVSFLPKLTYPTGMQPWSVVAGEVDGDGRPDIVLVNTKDKTISIYRNKTAGGVIGFDQNVNYTTPAGVGFVTLADLNFDGKPEIITTNSIANTISIFRNTSNVGVIALATKIDYATGPTPVNLAVADLDGDDKMDLAVVNENAYNATTTSTISIFRNTFTTGSISFAAKVDIVTVNRPSNVSTGDLNGDGKSDLVVGNPRSKSVSFFKNLSVPGDISFNAKLDFETGAAGSSCVGDLNGDGKPDVAVANVDTYSISLLKNISGEAVVKSLCRSGNISLTTEIQGTSYQWQMNSGSGFSNFVNSNHGFGTNTSTLHLLDVPSSWHSYQFRCIVDGAINSYYKLVFVNKWVGHISSDWGNSENWSCGTVPDANTDVTIDFGTVRLNVNATVRTLTINPNKDYVTFIIPPGKTLALTH